MILVWLYGTGVVLDGNSMETHSNGKTLIRLSK